MADINSFNLERTITIKGGLDGMSDAERLVVAKLRQSYENDLQALAPQSVMYPGLHPMAMMSTIGLGFSRGGPGLYGAGPASYPPVYPSAGPGQQAQPLSETVYLYVPSAAVGAIIGRKGNYIRNIIRFSGASVKIGQQEDEPLASPSPTEEGPEGGHKTPLLEHVSERKVTVYGTPEAQWKVRGVGWGWAGLGLKSGRVVYGGGER